jgi:uncharacterized protein YndB with AHSA1/START domain
MALSFTVSDVMPASKEAVYDAWLSSEKHTKMTNAESALASTIVGDSFTAYDGYISGKNVDLVPYTKIIQTWRTDDFSDDEEDSIIEITLKDNGPDKTLITLSHSNLPPDGKKYEDGWKTHYFLPMKNYFKMQS